jgi:hypothetical protein
MCHLSNTTLAPHLSRPLVFLVVAGVALELNQPCQPEYQTPPSPTTPLGIFFQLLASLRLGCLFTRASSRIWCGGGAFRGWLSRDLILSGWECRWDMTKGVNVLGDWSVEPPSTRLRV